MEGIPLPRLIAKGCSLIIVCQMRSFVVSLRALLGPFVPCSKHWFKFPSKGRDSADSHSVCWDD
jgi:hypothetical protein